MDAVAGELQCPVCLEFFNCPIILPCSHILCRTPCAERLFEHNFVRCPVCRDNSFVMGGAENLPRVITIENIIEQYKVGGVQRNTDHNICGAGDIPCQLCQSAPKKAVKSCLDCNASYCQDCLRISHPNKVPFSEHRLVEPQKYNKPRELRCNYHDVKVNIYCQDCQELGCLLCADDPKAHPGHHVMSLSQAFDTLKNSLLDGIKGLESSQEILADTIRGHHTKLQDFQGNVQERRSHINEQCESLIQEITMKKEFFLSDLEYEEKSKSDNLLQQITSYQSQCTNTQSVMQFAREVLKETDPCAFLQLYKVVNDKVKKSTITPMDIPPPSPSATTLNHKVVDFRKEKTVLKDMAYLTPPCTPVINVTKCSRSASSVVMVLCPPAHEADVIDSYEVYYCSDLQKRLGEQETMTFKTPQEQRKCGRGVTTGNAVCLIHNNLQSDTMYYFCVRAYNLSGESEMSEIVNCRTLSKVKCELKVPEIAETMCKTYTSSIQIYSPSPTQESEISHYLLYRESSADKIWKSVSMYGRLDHRVFGLESDTMYDFVVMANGKNGECQVSNMVTMRTERV